MRPCRPSINLKPVALLVLVLGIGLPTISVQPRLARAATEAEGESRSEILEPTGPIVARISWVGTVQLEEEQLEARVVTTARNPFDLRFWREPPRLDPFTLEEDIDRILALYAEEGYFETQARFEVNPITRNFFGEVDDPDTAEVKFRIEEGEATRLATWTIEVRPDGSDPDPPNAEEVARLVAVAPTDNLQSMRFGSRLYTERRKKLLVECAELGFPNARIEGGADVDTATNEAIVDWTLYLGLRQSIGKISFSGLDGVDLEIVRRELTFRAGDRFRPSALDQSERRLVETGLFRTVVIGRPIDGPGSESSSEEIPIEIRVEEALPRSFRASVGYGAEDGPRGDISLEWKNFLGNARRLRLRAFGSLLDVGFEGSLAQPYFFHPSLRGDLSASALRQSRPGYEAFVTGAAGILTFRTERDSKWSFSIGPGYELSEILDFGIVGDQDIRGPRDSTIVNLFSALHFDWVDNLIDPSNGVRAKLGGELGSRYFGSDLDFAQTEIDLRGYVGTGPFVFAARVALTTLDPFDGGRARVPLTRRLYAGGTSSVRGFGFQRLGPEDANNDPVGGLTRIELGSELRWRFWPPFALVAFVDAGDVQREPWTLRPEELRASAGPGLRLDTPVGPLRLDAGFLLNPPKNTDPWRIHISVGHAF